MILQEKILPIQTIFPDFVRSINYFLFVAERQQYLVNR